MNDELIEQVALRFWSKVNKRSVNECWEWQAYVGTGGYGGFSIGQKPQRAHRVAYSLAFGPIPDGLLVCHRCDNSLCCNPAHLFLGTHADNNRDKAAKGRNVRPPRDESSVNYTRGSKSHFAKLTEADVRRIRQRKANGEKSLHLAKEFEVSPSLIWLISTRKVWSHVE